MSRSLLFGPFRLDLAGKQLWRDGKEVSLTPRALDLLAYLAGHAGQLLTRDELFNALWPGVIVADHALSVQIREIRKALDEDIHDPQYIETRHRRGYRFKAPVTVAAEPTPALRPEWTPAVASGSAAAPPPSTATATPVTNMASTIRMLAMPETRYVESTGRVNIAYQVAGDGPVDLVFVMGWVSHIEYFWTEPRFSRFLRRLSAFSRVILLDKRGTGLSDRVPNDQLPTIEQRMEDVHAVMDRVGSERAVICGVSEGGCMSAVFAATYPERAEALVMIGSYARRLWAPDYPWGPTPEQRGVLLRAIREQWGGPVGLEERAPSVASDPEFRDWWSAYLRLGASPGAALALTTMNSETDIRNVLPLVRVPALVLHRTGDLCLKVEEGRHLASLIPGAKFVELPGSDHLPFVGDQESILEEIEQFLEQVQGRSGPESSLATVLAIEMEGAASPDPKLEAGLRATLDRFRVRQADYSFPGLSAAFDGPARAVQCALALRQQLRRLHIGCRTGLHTGEITGRPKAMIAGAAVDIASLIRGRAQWDQVLASGTLRDLVAGSGIAFRPQGRMEVAGVGEWQLLEVQSS